MRHCEDAVTLLISGLCYDWSHFTLEQFVTFMAQHLQRQIVVVGMPCPPGLSALWLPRPGADFIIYRSDAPVVLRIHAVLHELGHIALGHHGYTISEDQLETALHALGAAKTAVQDRPEERDAERFALEVQMRVHHARARDLEQRGTTIPGLQYVVESGF